MSSGRAVLSATVRGATRPEWDARPESDNLYGAGGRHPVGGAAFEGCVQCAVATELLEKQAVPCADAVAQRWCLCGSVGGRVGSGETLYNIYKAINNFGLILHFNYPYVSYRTAKICFC